MILGMEVALTIMGLIMLVRGRGLGKEAVAHWQYRLIGGFLITLLPVAFVGAMLIAVIWGLTASETDNSESVKWWITGMELGLAVLYIIVVTIWEKALKRRIEAEATRRFDGIDPGETQTPS